MTPADYRNHHFVAPPSPVLFNATAERTSIRYTRHGPGPALGALKGAVIASPAAVQGHPKAAYTLAIVATTAGSVARCASECGL